MAVINAIEGVFSIVLMISLGWILTLRGWFTEETSKLFARLVIVVALPVYMLWNMSQTFSSEKLLNLGGGVIVPLISMLLSYLAGYLVSKLLNISRERRGTFRSMYVASNSAFIGIPVNLALFGEQSVPYALLFYISNTISFWTVGAYGISADSRGGGQKILTVETVKRIFSPPFIGFMAAIVLILLDIKLPAFIMTTCKYIGSLTTPMSMLFIGIAVYGVKLKDVRIDKEIAAVLFGRFVIAPMAVLLITSFLTVPELMRKVFVMQAAMPVMTQTAVVAKNYQADSEYVAVATTLTTLLAIVVIPIYMIVLTKLI